MISVLLLGSALAQDAPVASEEPAKIVHWSEVQVKSRVYPKFPEAAKELGIEEAVCKIRFTIDEAGLPDAIDIVECPKVFEESTLEAAWKWRFYPLKVDGLPVKATFVLNVKYVLTGPSEGPLGVYTAIGLGAGVLHGDGAAALQLDVLMGPPERWFGEVRAGGLRGPISQREQAGLWRIDLGGGPALWTGPLGVGLYAGLGVDKDRSKYANLLRLSGGPELWLRPTDGLMFQLSGRPAWVFLGPDVRKNPGFIDEIAVEGSLWLAPWHEPDGFRNGVHLTGGWLDWPEENVFYAALGVGSIADRPD